MKGTMGRPKGTPKTGGRDFLPGNPGRPKMPEDQKLAMLAIQQMRRKASHSWTTSFEKFQDMPMADIAKFVGTKEKPNLDAPVIELLVARGILRVLSTGKASDMATIKEMMCGPEPKQVELSGPGGEPISPFAGYTPEAMAKAFKEVDKFIREVECKSTPKQQPSSELPPASSPPSSGTES